MIIIISEKVKNAAEKAMPKEKRFIEKVEGFFEKKPRRLIFSGVSATILLLLLFVVTETAGFFSVPNAVLGFAELIAVGAFFANINSFSLKKFAVAVSISSVVLYLALLTYGMITAIDLSRLDTAAVIWTGKAILGIPVCATMIALTVLLAYFTVCRKTK